MKLPEETERAIEAEAASIPTRKLAAAVERLGRYYQSPDTERAPSFAIPEVRIAYALTRMPAIFQVNRLVLAALEPMQPAIASVLDLGCGPGTATIATCEAFEGLRKATLIDRDDGWFDLGRRMVSAVDASVETRFVKSAIERAGSFEDHDLVIASYALGELPSSDARDVIARAWPAARMGIAIVEPGTPHGFATILAARDELIGAGAAIAAPCTHALGCPMASGDWCHFDTRVERTPRHRRAKSGTLPYEVEKFSYLVATKSPLSSRPTASRVIKHPLKRGGHVVLDLCTSLGRAERIVVSRRDKEAYRDARDAKWGDVWVENDR